MKRPLCVLAGLLAATLLAGAASAADLISLRLGDVKGDRYAALRASGELDDLPYKLEMSAFPSGAPVLEALNAGALDIGFTGDIPFLFVYAAGAPLKAVGAWHFNPATVALVVGKDSPIRSVAGLKGKRIAVNRGGWGHFLALGALRRAGLGPQDVSFSFLGPVDGRAALVRGSVDAWVPWEPYTSSAVLLDQARVIDNGAGIMTGYSYALASDAAIARKKAAISDLLTRLARAQAWALRHPEAFAEALAKGDLTLAAALLVPLSAANCIRRWGSPSQQAQWLPAFVSEEGAPLTAIAVNEPSLLFDPQKLATRARRKGSHYLLSGEKCLVLRGLEASRLIVAAKTDEGPALFLVEASAKGVERRAEPAMGLKAGGTARLRLKSVKVPADNRLTTGPSSITRPWPGVPWRWAPDRRRWTT
ncbi:hypothetical protein ALP65_01993 [Pseudomonas aeruginosa]|uniref:Putative aliphatic sulfonates-binding protein n=1 Tax=Pseudomonas aeruginosa TaxID=287 RepID=A0A3M5DXQ4_PSEAI|nr:hypothetical protein ALP65_01993 [Pseudomonas aeruginosa]